MPKPPNKTEVIKKIKKQFPLEMLNQPIWIAYYYKQNKDGTLSKPPCARRGHTVKDSEPGVTFEEACEDGYPGIKVNGHTDLVAFDIDDKDAKLGKRKFEIDRLSDDFQEFVISQDSYMEYSPSGCGLRILMRCDNKEGLPGRVNLNSELCIGGELFINSGYVTITGDYLAGDGIKEVSAYQLKTWYQDRPAPQAEVIDIPVDFKYPDISLVKEALNCCKLNQNSRVKLAYKTVMNQEYNHYDYWLKIMAACHDYAIKTGQMQQLTSMVVEWSQTDEISYEDDEDVITHWSSFSSKENSITYHTLMKFAKLLRFQWPEEKFDNKGNPTGKPIPSSLVNFEYLMDYLELKVHTDIFNGDLYVTGDKDIINKFFITNETRTYFGMTGPFSITLLEAVICRMAQQNGYQGITVSSIIQLFRNYFSTHSQKFNMMEKWLTTDPALIPEDMVEQNTNVSKSNLEYLLSCIQFNDSQNMPLVKQYFDTFFYELVMPIYNPKRILSHRSFMLILTGPEACRKTTFFSMLFPASLRRQFVTNSTETLGGAKSIRDFNTSLVTSALVVCDEFENFYNPKNDSLFKTLVTQDVVDYVPIYEKTMRKEDRNAVIAGTTNKRSLAFEQSNNRRFAFADVVWIDTDAMRDINWHHFYRDYISKGKQALMNGQHPWKLSMETIKEQYLENERFRSQSNKEIILREVFDFDMNTHQEVVAYDRPGIQNSEHLYKMKDIIAILKQQYPEVYFSPAEMKHLLKRLCSAYTHTTNQKKLLVHAKGHVENGIVKQSDKLRYVMPPKLTDFD
jgi:hypothetical protein